jgi:peptidoglycan biosynthesis protein MviN/MurJ (putative lipid II flippase)
LKQSVFLALFGIIQLISGFLINILIIRIYGVGLETDAFVAGQVVPNLIFGLVVSALNSVWLPRLSSERYDPEIWGNILSKSLGQASVIFLGISIFVVLFSRYYFHLIFPGFNSIQLESAFKYTCVFSLTVFFSLLSNQLINALRTLNKYYIVELISLLGAISILPIIYIYGSKNNLLYISYIMLIRTVVVFLFQMYFAGWPKILFIEGIRDKDSWKLMKPIFLGSSIYKFAPLFDRFLLSFAPPGTMTLFNISQNFITAGSQIVEKSLVMPFTTQVGNIVKNNKFKEIKFRIVQIFVQVNILTIFLILLSVFFKEITINTFTFLFNISEIDAKSMWFFCILMVGYFSFSPLGALPVSVFYSLKDTNTPAVIGIVGFLLSILMKIIGFKFLGTEGLILAFSIYYFLGFTMNIIYLNKKYEFNS